MRKTAGVQGHGGSKIPFTLRPVILWIIGFPKDELLHLYPFCCSKAPSKGSWLSWEEADEGTQQLSLHRPLCCLTYRCCWKRWSGRKQPHQIHSSHLSFPLKNVTAAPSTFYNYVYHCSSIVWDNKWLEMNIYHQEISACPFPQAVS